MGISSGNFLATGSQLRCYDFNAGSADFDFHSSNDYVRTESPSLNMQLLEIPTALGFLH